MPGTKHLAPHTGHSKPLRSMRPFRSQWDQFKSDTDTHDTNYNDNHDDDNDQPVDPWGTDIKWCRWDNYEYDTLDITFFEQKHRIRLW